METYSCSDIIKDYSNKYMFIKTNDDIFWSFSALGRIGVPAKSFHSRYAIDTFHLLHEIGHCETYHIKQFKVQREFNATQWAIEHSKQYDVVSSESSKKIWQDYIYSFTKAKDKSKYQLDWSPMEGINYENT